MSLAAAMKPKGSGIAGGWLSMAPQVDEEPSSSSSSSIPQASTVPAPAPPPPTRIAQGVSNLQCASSSSNNNNDNKPEISSSSSSSSGGSKGYQQRPLVGSTAASRILPRTNARFKVGDSSALATPASFAPDSPYSRDSGYDSPPPFDVRASFAPMPKWGAFTAVNDTSTQDRRESNVTVAGDEATEIKIAAAKALPNGKKEDLQQVETPEDEKGIMHGGIQWKGKTAHAVELEMEALGDRTVMSYAPDAVYLASRLEGLKRNLDVGGDRFKRWAWEDFDEGEKSDEAAPTNEDVDMEGDTKVSIVGEVEGVAAPISTEDQAVTTVSSPGASAGSTPADLTDNVMDLTMEGSTVPDAGMETDAPAMSGVSDMAGAKSEAVTATDKNAKEAALDARVEIRTLRRPDLEQIRELHCYHGNSDKVDTETYTTSAGFLLRLLVDEHHVCLVAVAKPLPEPPSLPTRFAPGAPPPSLDMPPSQSPFLLAGHSRTATAHAALRKHAPHHGSRLAPLAHASRGILEAPAPRSFGVGADSSSSREDEQDEEERDLPLFAEAKKSSNLESGDTSPDAIAEVDEDQVAKEDAEAGQDLEGLRVPSTGAKAAPTHAVSVLAGPTHDVAPPRAIRVMGAPPLNGLPTDSEVILGVASARIKVVQRLEGDDPFGKSEALDSSWPGLDPRGNKSMVTREAHIITLSVQPSERGQGLGARLLDRLLDECKRRTAGPRVYLPSDDARAAETAPRVHENAPMRTFLEVHPSNTSAIGLYNSRHFRQVEGSKGVVKHYFRGDNRIPNSIRVKIGGSDAIRLERFDFK